MMLWPSWMTWASITNLHEGDTNMNELSVLVYRKKYDRMFVRSSLQSFQGPLHCGQTLEVLIDNQWVPTRLEYGRRWFLVGIDTMDINGLIVKIK